MTPSCFSFILLDYLRKKHLFYIVHHSFKHVYTSIISLSLCITLQRTRESFIPGSSHGKESSCNAGNRGSIPGWARSPGGGNGNPLQYSCLEIPWSEEPGRLWSIGLQRVGHDWSDLAVTLFWGRWFHPPLQWRRLKELCESSHSLMTRN